MMAVTLSDVAKHAGVSPATVSRVINNDELHPVSQKTAKAVLRSIVELGYSPNEYARNLSKRGPSFKGKLSLGILLASSMDSYNDPFFYDILMGIQAQATEMGYSLGFTYSFSENPFSFVRDNIQMNHTDGMIMMGRTNAETLQFIKKNVKNVVYAGLNPVGHDFDEVVCDSPACVKLAVTHLAKLGRKTIGFIGNAVSSNSATLVNEYRYDGYIEALHELGLPFDKDYVIDTPLKIDPAYQATFDRLAKGKIPDAFFCANDYCAIGALKALHNHKLKVPQRVAIVSIDDIDMASYSRPMLTTIHIPRTEIGKFAVKVLIDKIETRRKYPIRLSLPFELIVRESCGAVLIGDKPIL